jgi:hypothetical protein
MEWPILMLLLLLLLLVLMSGRAWRISHLDVCLWLLM